MSRLAIILLFGLLLPQTSQAAPPKELYGKSVIVTWTEVREQRTEGEQAWRSVQGSQALNIYVSEAGRVFNNLVYATDRGSANRGDQIAGQGGNRAIAFNGRSLLMMSPHGKGGANRISVDFDSSYASCTAEVLKAKESEGTIIKSYSQIIKHMLEIRSIKVSGSACSVRSGNVFGN
jgi:hypothetical protein